MSEVMVLHKICRKLPWYNIPLRIIGISQSAIRNHQKYS